MGHINELRKRLTVIFAVVSVAIIALYPFTDQIYQILVKPVKPILDNVPQHLALASGILGPMMVRFSMALWAGIVLSSPLIIWQSMMFFLPALKPRERKYLIPTFFVGVVLFIFGVVFCYSIILQASFQWLADQSGHIMVLWPQIDDLVQVIEFFLLGFGIAFQTPIVVFYLVFFGVVQYKVLRKNWRQVYVVTFIVAAGITPDWSPVSMFALAGAMIILYEMSLALVRIVLRNRIKEQAVLAAAEAAKLD